jgi:uncharacterized protein (TIGR03067 family)
MPMEARMIFSGDELSVEWVVNGNVKKAKEGEPKTKVQLRCNVVPKQMDMFFVSPLLGEHLIEEDIYDLKDANLTIAFPNPSWGRPTDFSGRATDKGEVQVWHLKRERRGIK